MPRAYYSPYANVNLETRAITEGWRPQQSAFNSLWYDLQDTEIFGTFTHDEPILLLGHNLKFREKNTL